MKPLINAYPKTIIMLFPQINLPLEYCQSVGLCGVDSQLLFLIVGNPSIINTYLAMYPGSW